MKYKVILYNQFGAGNDDIAGNFTFYTFNSAHDCAQAWSALSGNYSAYLWDGTTWRTY